LNHPTSLATLIENAPYDKLVNWSSTIQEKYSLETPPDNEKELREWLLHHAIKEERYTFHKIPAELKNQTRWVCWKQESRDGKLTKIPYDIRTHDKASSTDPGTWGNYEQAIVAYHKHNYDGIGFMFHENDGLVGIDWDHVRDAETGDWDPETLKEILAFQSYAEISPSQTGAHCIVKGKKPGDRCRKGNYEMYSKDRYFTFTGHHIPESPPTINVAKPELIEAFYRKLGDDTTPSQPQREGEPTRASPKMEDDEIISRASNAKNGKKFQSLWNGSWSGLYPSQSEADEALCFMLSFYTKDPTQIDRLFRKSKLYREKWDREDYRLKTIGSAIIKVTEEYVDPGKQQRIPPPDERHCTDYGNCERFINLHGADVKYCKVFDAWYLWTQEEGRWKKDLLGAIQECAKETVRSIYAEAGRSGSDDERRKLAKWAMQCETTAHTNAIITLAKSDPFVVTEHDAFDQNLMVLNLANGTYNLSTHILEPHRKELLITKQAPIWYDPTADCPLFLAFLNRIFISHPEIIPYLQRAIGYTLTGITQEDILFLLYGSGANGKSTLLNVLEALLGDYSVNTESSTFTTNRSDNVRNDLARLVGARLVTAAENSMDSNLDETLIKQLTGGDKIAARFLFQEYFEYRPTFKIWWCFNHMPRIRDTTNSTWRRIHLIPFKESIPESEQDKNMSEKLLEELPGILNWAIDGLKEYQNGGLNPPEIVVTTTTEYRNDQDQLFDFFADMIDVATGDEPIGIVFEEKGSVVYSAYMQWTSFNNEKPMSNTMFGNLLKERGIKKVRKNKGVYYVGIRIKPGHK